MDTRDALRRYLEQRRDLGESELVLDALTVDEVMKLVGAANLKPRAASRPSSAPAAGTSRPSSAPTAAAMRPAPIAEETSGDWRAAIRAAGGAPASSPASRTSKEPEPMPKRPTADEPLPLDSMVESSGPGAIPAGAGTVSPLDDVPVGLVVGSATRGTFDDVASNLESLEAIAGAVAKCERCKLYLTATNPVPGTGNPNADFMIVGEAPGANEDEQGVPFVGQAGQLLTKIIGAIDLGRDDVFIANVLKHRPPGNRNPTPDEVAACSPYLIRQIELVQPKVILALGTFAAQTLLETKLTIGKLRGQIHRYHGVPLVVTYHPAALLRNPAWKRPTWEDVQLARRILDRAVADRA
jgi:DNA polymerase